MSRKSSACTLDRSRGRGLAEKLIGTRVSLTEPGRTRNPGQPWNPGQNPGQPVPESIGRAAALFANGQKEQAIAEMKQINAIPDRTGYLYQEMAQILAAAANRQPTLEGFEWLWEEAFSNWYAWGSGATSSGEGTERGRHIKQAHRDYEAAKAERLRFGS